MYLSTTLSLLKWMHLLNIVYTLFLSLLHTHTPRYRHRTLVRFECLLEEKITMMVRDQYLMVCLSQTEFIFVH